MQPNQLFQGQSYEARTNYNNVGAAQFQGVANNHHNHQQQLQQQQQQQAVALPTQPPPLPPGWVAATDPVSGHVYYANASTGETSWEPPRMPIPVPLPPPPPPVHVVVPPIHASSPAPASTIHAIHHHQQQQHHHLSQQPMQVLPSQPQQIHIQSPAAMPIQLQTVTGTTATTMPTPLLNTDASIAATSGLLIPTTRATMNRALATTTDADVTATQDPRKQKQTLEYEELTCGTIADLAHVQLDYRVEQHQSHSAPPLNGDGRDHAEEEEEDEDPVVDQKKFYYEPLKPFEMPVVAKVPHIEPGRVDIRVMSLMDALSKIS